MPKTMLKLDAQGPTNVEVSWGLFYKDIVVKVDGQPIGRMADRKELQQGRAFSLEGIPGREGSIEVKQLGGMMPMLQVTRDGVPLPGSATDPTKLASQARNVVYVIAALNLVIGVVTLGLDIPALSDAGFGLGSLAFGAVFAFLGAMIHWRESWIALVVAIVFFAGDAAATLLWSLSDGHPPQVTHLIVRVFLLVMMVRGVRALQQKAQMNKPDVGARGESTGSPVAVSVRTDGGEG